VEIPKNKGGEMKKIKFSICNEVFENWAIGDVFKFVQETGYDGVEIAPFTLNETVAEISPEQRRAIRQQAEQLGLEIVGLHWLLVSPKGLYINHPDEKVRKATQDYLIQLIHFCGDLGGKRMVVGSPKQRNVMENHSFEETWKWTTEVFDTCMPTAEERGVVLCIEPLDAEQTNFINTAAEGVRLVEEVDHPNFRLMLDTKATIAQGKVMEEEIRTYSRYLVHIHANDVNARGPGFGDVDFAPIAAALKDVDYQGYVSVEVFDFKPDPETIARESFRYLKDIF
jgi:sugar phosphate isomerase/epimerase